MIVFWNGNVRYLLDLDGGRLWKDDGRREEVALTPRPMEVLRYLAAHAGQVVTRPELFQHVWGTAIVEDNSVDQAVSKARFAVGDQGRPNRVVQTVSGRGFKFIASIETDTETRPTVKGALGPYATVPPLPPTFFERPEITEPLIEKVTGGGAIVGITAVEGMGGVGKTLVTLGLCHDPRVRAAFPDGIVWVDVGKEAVRSFAEQVKFIAHALNAEFGEYGAAEYRSLLEGKAVLVVLDDVWKLEDVEPFRMGAGRSKLLYSSRDKTLAGPLGAENQDVGELDPEQARRFLARWSGREMKAPPEPEATRILEECKGLALGLAMMGAALKGHPDSEWGNVLADLKQARLKEVGARRPGGYAYQTLHAAIEVGVNALAAEEKARYLKLAILLEDLPAPAALLRQLWGGDERSVQRTMKLFCDRSLARREAGGIRLHDFQLDYVRGEHPHPDALVLERGAMVLSSHVVREHPEELGSQLTGRLLAHRENAGVSAFLDELRESTPLPRLWPLWPALTAPGGPLRRILQGHTGRVNAIAITADGKRAISGSADGTLRVWDLEGNQPARVLEGHTAEVRAVALTADGQRAISGSDDGTLRVWDLEGNQPPRVLEGRTSWVSAVALTADGQRAISGSDDGTLRVWDLEGTQPARVLEGHTAGVSAVALTADGQRAISGSSDGTLRVWDLEGNQPARVLEGHTNWVLAVALTADGKRGISGTADGTLRVWDLEGNQPARVLEGHTAWVLAVALTADGKRGISGSADGTLRVWDLEGNQPARVLEGHTSEVRAVALTADGKRGISGSDDGTLRVWDLEGNQPARVLKGHTSWVSAVALTADGQRAISGSGDGTLRVWDLEGNQPARVLEGHTAEVIAVALTADGQRAISGCDDGTLRVWDLEGNQPARVLEGHTAEVIAVALTADGQRAISGSDDGTLRVWDPEGNQPTRVLEGHTAWVRAVALTADGQRAISASEDRTLRVWDLESNRCLVRFTCDSIVLACAVVGDRVVVGDYGGNLHVFAWEE